MTATFHPASVSHPPPPEDINITPDAPTSVDRDDDACPELEPRAITDMRYSRRNSLLFIH
jgi:hypothetical protein